MKHLFSIILFPLWCILGTVQLHAQSTAFTYQGQLTSGVSLANGRHDFRFTLFAAPSGGSPVDESLTLAAVGVTNGLFTVSLDFGSAVFSGKDRWLEIAVRTNGGSAFTTLNPRQPVMPTPYALTALNAINVPGLDRHALHAADGSPSNAVFVDAAGKVGIGTTSPQEKFDVRSGDGSYVRIDRENGDIKVNGGSDGQWGIFNDGPSTGGTHLIGEGQTRFFVANTGNVGIGTTTPQARLEVRGDVRMGAGGELHAAGGAENLRIVRGEVSANGGIAAGSGFSVGVVQVDGTMYTIIFDPPFSAPPTVTATAQLVPGVLRWAGLAGHNHGAANVVLLDPFSPGSPVAGPFHFIAIGPR